MIWGDRHESFLSAIGGFVGFAIGLISFVSGIGILFFTDSYLAFIAEHVLPVANLVGMLGIGVSVLIGLPFLIFRRTRIASEVIFSLAALCVGFSVSLFSLLLIYSEWGKFWTILVIIFLPLISIFAGLAQAFAGNWSVVGMLILNIIVWLILLAGASFASKLQNR